MNSILRSWPKHRGNGELIPLPVERDPRPFYVFVIVLLVVFVMTAVLLFFGIGRAEARCNAITLCFGGFPSHAEALNFVGYLDTFEQLSADPKLQLDGQWEMKVVFEGHPLGNLCASRVFTTPTVPVACDHAVNGSIEVFKATHGVANQSPSGIFTDSDGNWFVEAPLR